VKIREKLTWNGLKESRIKRKNPASHISTIKRDKGNPNTPRLGERGFILDYIICIENKRVDGYREEKGVDTINK
jgi:hypothetical protein